MMRKSRVLKNLAEGNPTLGVCLHLLDSAVYEMASLMGLEAIWMDLEHHFTSLETAAHLMRAARVGGADIIARPGKGEFGRMARLLEAGATGIMYPRCESAAEAAEVVRWAKFAPIGQRGFDGSGPDVPYLLTPMAEYLQQANAETFIVIQIEDQIALQQAEEIASVPGVDMLMLGPADFSILTGVPGEFHHPTIPAAIRQVSRAALNTGKNWAATCGSLEQVAEMIELGARLVFHSCDIVLVKNGLDQILRGFRKQQSETQRDGRTGSYLERT